MGQDPWEGLEATRQATIARYDVIGQQVLADALRAGGPVPPQLSGTPLIVDTDVGGDPDDAVALLVAARQLPELALVVTSDEIRGERARFARYLLDLAGRPEVPVVAGRQLVEATRYFCVEGMTPPEVPAQPSGTVAAIGSVCDGFSGWVRWVGMGPMSNLADLVRARPDVVERLKVTQMGGAFPYRDAQRAEHNIRLDLGAARIVLAAVRGPRLVTSNVTFVPEMELTRDSSLYRWLSRPGAPVWAAVLTEHLNRWFERFYPGSMQHDALTLSVAMQLPFVRSILMDVVLDEIGRTVRVKAGDATGFERVRAFVSLRALYDAFQPWLEHQLVSEAAALQPSP